MQNWIVRFFILSFLFLLAGIANAFSGEQPTNKLEQAEVEKSIEEVEIEKVNETIIHILTKGLPKHRIRPWLKHPLLKRPKDMRRISRAIYEAAKLKDVPIPVLITIGFREGSFRPGSKGGIGELSMFQMTKGTAREAKKLEPLCDLSTIEGAAICSATWLGHWKERCGDWHGSFSVYATGKTCKPVNDRVEWLAGDRVGITKKLTTKFWTTKESSLNLI